MCSPRFGTRYPSRSPRSHGSGERSRLVGSIGSWYAGTNEAKNNFNSKRGLFLCLVFPLGGKGFFYRLCLGLQLSRLAQPDEKTRGFNCTTIAVNVNYISLHSCRHQYNVQRLTFPSFCFCNAAVSFCLSCRLLGSWINGRGSKNDGKPRIPKENEGNDKG